MKRIGIIILTVCVVLLTSAFTLTSANTTTSEADIPSENTEIIVLESSVVERVETTDPETLKQLIDDSYTRREEAHEMAESARALGYEETHPVIVLAQTEWSNANEDYDYYSAAYEEVKAEEYATQKAEYPVATQVWIYMQEEFGWNDIVCAGIIGNMMAECGGCWSSDLNWSVNGSSGYGMIQWIGARKNALFTTYGSQPSVEDQLNFMRDELYGTNGVTRQVNDAQFNKIMNATTPEDCAYAFASYFERCGEKHRAPRRGYARRAYNYFVG